MSENTNTIPAASEEFETFLPEGWAEGDNIFDVDSWTGGGDQADESDAGDGQEEVTEAEEGTEDETLTTGGDEAAEESGEDGGNAPTNEQETERPKLKFSAKIDHKVQDVELDETELPTIYQKAQNADRTRSKLDKVQPIIDKGNRLAKILGYDTMDAMLDAAEKSYREGEVERLKGEGVHPDVAEELVESRTKRALESVPAEQPDTDDEADTGRDYRGEVADLLQAHPELRGTQLPASVVNACVAEGKPLVRAYEEYARKQAEAENKAVKAENKRLKQNADAARRAPVRGVSKGGKTNTDPDDPFLIGFNSDHW
jgi:hypothetical protein